MNKRCKPMMSRRKKIFVILFNIQWVQLDYLKFKN